jgi:hypothetical protein
MWMLQMARMLDVLEAFLNLHGHTYMRLDGSTKPEQRQVKLWEARKGCCHSERFMMCRWSL